VSIEERIFLDILAKFTAEDLRNAIKSKVDLAELAETYAPDLVNLGRFLSFFHRSETLDFNEFLEYLRVKRPDLYQVLVEDNGIEWLRINFMKIKKLLGLR
jgi:hypothetical protein